MQVLSATKKEFYRLYHRFTGSAMGYRVQTRCDKRLFGNWWLCMEGLCGNSVIYSCGVGTDIQFDLELIERVGCRVHAFDPTPESLSWLRTQELPESFIYHPWAIAGVNGEGDLTALGGDSKYRSVSVHRPEGSSGTVRVPLKRVQTIMKELGHGTLDVLKMDIEGSEYEVLEDIMNSGIRPAQIAVEFHHRFPEIGMEKTRDAISHLMGCGYEIIHINTWRAQEMTFLRRDRIGSP